MTDYEYRVNSIKDRVETAVEQILEAEGYLRRGMPGNTVSRLTIAGKIATQCGERLYEIVLEKMHENKEATR